MPLFVPHTVTSRPTRSPRRNAARVALAALPLALWLAGCSTPMLHPSVDVPSRYAAAASSETEPETAWWESYGDPVLSDLIRRAATANRDVRIAAQRVQAARAGEIDPRPRGPADDRDQHVFAVPAADHDARAVDVDVEPRELGAVATAAAGAGRRGQVVSEQLEQQAADRVPVEGARLHQPVAPNRSVRIDTGS